MNKGELLDYVFQRRHTGFARCHTDKAINDALQHIIDVLATGEIVAIGNFGSFCVESGAVKFVPSKRMRDAVSRNETTEQPRYMVYCWGSGEIRILDRQGVGTLPEGTLPILSHDDREQLDEALSMLSELGSQGGYFVPGLGVANVDGAAPLERLELFKKRLQMALED